jgi:uncharacterized repeat protein (TIGR03843 family)
MYLIDHGLCFHSEDKLRTVIWDFAGETMPTALVSSLKTFQATLHLGLSVALQQYLTAEELAALDARSAGLLANPVFPQPPEDRRSFPYPPL